MACKKSKTETEIIGFAGIVTTCSSGIPEPNINVEVTAIKQGSAWTYESKVVGEALTNDKGFYLIQIINPYFEADEYSVSFKKKYNSSANNINLSKFKRDSLINTNKKAFEVNTCF
jgi:hypothetical protein